MSDNLLIPIEFRGQGEDSNISCHIETVRKVGEYPVG
jgi:hypothetical protein